MNRVQKIWKWGLTRRNWEAWIWIAALIALAFTNPNGEGHLSLCPIKNMGWSFCPGCGLGHSISWLFRGEINHSIQSHPLGILALGILLFRIFNILTNSSFTKINSNF